MSFRDFFADDYAAARARFLEACPDAASFEYGSVGPGGEPLATDVAWFGPRDAARVVLVTSGTHGLEGLPGSACQVGWVRSGGPTDLPPGTAVLLIHLINPYGAAWGTRETEEGVDLNRNFVDHRAPPENPAYEQIHDALMSDPQDQSFLARFRQEQGARGYAQALFGGQYRWPEGLHFGGSAPSASNRLLTAIVDEYLGGTTQLVHLDYHTGLGPWAHASLIAFRDSSDPVVDRAIRRYGPSVLPVGTAVGGDVGSGIAAALPHVETTSLTVEYGTYDLDTEFRVVCDNFWLRRHGDPTSERGRKIRASIVEYFYPSSWDWRELVWRRSQQIIRRSLPEVVQEISLP